jgi:hypothetical protein
MLRTYKPLDDHPIFTLHRYTEHLICNVWCRATAINSCSDLLDENFEVIYNAYDWLKKDIDTVYEACKTLTDDERTEIREAFNINNRIIELCSGDLKPIALDSLPEVVKKSMKPLLVKFYDYLIDRTKVPGNKLDYYNKLIDKNDFKTCPCCGLSLIESADTHYREDNDHYLPKADYPFASVNFQNLVPLCSKCNKKCKSTKNPFSNDRISYFPFENGRDDLDVLVSINGNDDLDYLKLKADEVGIDLSGDIDKNSTWDYLFEIKERYNEQVREFSKTELRVIANRLLRNSKRKQGLTYAEILDEAIEDYSIEIFEDRKFLKKPFLETMKTKPEWMAVYKLNAQS